MPIIIEAASNMMAKVANANCESANIIESKENEHVAAVLRAKSRIAAHRITSTHA